MANEKPEQAAPTLSSVLTKEETALLWQLCNAPGVSAPLAAAALAAGFYAKVRAAAVAHGVVAS